METERIRAEERERIRAEERAEERFRAAEDRRREDRRFQMQMQQQMQMMMLLVNPRAIPQVPQFHTPTTQSVVDSPEVVCEGFDGQDIINLELMKRTTGV